MRASKDYFKLPKPYQDRIENEYEEEKIRRFIEAKGYHPNLDLLALRGPRLDEPGYPRRTLEINGGVVKIREIPGKILAKGSGRKGIAKFSMKSRKRFYEFLQSIYWDKYDQNRIFEITLTYHVKFPLDGKEVKKHIHSLRKNIMDKYPDTILIWKLEFQRRGAPHFHLIMIAPCDIELGDYQYWNEDNQITYYDRETKTHHETGIAGFRAYIQTRWNTITAESIEHFNSSIEVDHVRNPKGMPLYLAKYIAKEQKAHSEYQHIVPEQYKDVGRFWGCYNREGLHIMKKKFLITESTYETMQDLIKTSWKNNNLPEYRTHSWGMNCYTMTKDQIEREVFDILIDHEELRN